MLPSTDIVVKYRKKLPINQLFQVTHFSTKLIFHSAVRGLSKLIFPSGMPFLM